MGVPRCMSLWGDCLEVSRFPCLGYTKYADHTTEQRTYKANPSKVFTEWHVFLWPDGEKLKLEVFHGGLGGDGDQRFGSVLIVREDQFHFSHRRCHRWHHLILCFHLDLSRTRPMHGLGSESSYFGRWAVPSMRQKKAVEGRWLGLLLTLLDEWRESVRAAESRGSLEIRDPLAVAIL